MKKQLTLFDSAKKQKLLFEPMEDGKVSVYVCGPTVYDDAHLGHARSAIVFDLLHRVLKANGYEVTFVKNFTDIDDKIIKKIEQTGKSLEELTAYYIKAYQEEMELLNILPNTFEPKATHNIDSMKQMIGKLLEKDIAYIIEDGVYLDTSKDHDYGTLSKKIDDEHSQSRVEVKQSKRDQKDFALWKFCSTDEIGFEAPFGYGRPGWHLECSAMIDKHLAKDGLPYAVDIHGGGADLLFPHHENEASQTRCCTSQELAKYWLHNGFVNIDGQKMSKSLGNSFFLKDCLQNYNGEVVRFYMLSTYYRSDLSFNETDLLASKKRLDKIYRLKKRVYGLGSGQVSNELQEKVLSSLNDDMNTSIAFAVLDEYISSVNEKLNTNPKDKNLKKQIVATIEFLAQILGIGYQDPFEYFQFGIDQSLKNKIEELIIQRSEAKKAKDFEKSDAIRDELNSLGVSIMDTPQGTVWEKN